MELIVFDFIDVSVVDEKIQRIVFLFPYFLYFSSESALLSNGLEIQLTITLSLYLTKIVIATSPNFIVPILINHSDAGDARCVDYAPLHIIII